MGRMNIKELQAFRVLKKKEFSLKEKEEIISITVGMGTCGIAAGAKKTFDAIKNAIIEAGLEKKVVMKQTGCMGLCYIEPTVEVHVPGMPEIFYGKMLENNARDFVKKHLLEKQLLDGHIIDRPAIDIQKIGEKK